MTSEKASDLVFMQQALDQAFIAYTHKEVPVGSLIVNKQKEILGMGYNCPIQRSDPTAHAELIALRQACAKEGNYRLPAGCTVYVTLTPCLMCTGALLHARVERLVIGTHDTRANSLHHQVNLFQSDAFNHKITVDYGCLAEESKMLLNRFFQERRDR